MHFLSLDIYKGKYADFLKIIKNPQKKTLVFTPNPEILLRASKDEEFRNNLAKADYLTPDGNGLYVASLMQEGKGYFSAIYSFITDRKSLTQKYGELIKGSDSTSDLIFYAEKKEKRILIIDSYKIINPANPFEVQKQKVQEQMTSLLKEKFPSLWVQVFFDGAMSPDGIAHHIELNHIDYVFACNGMRYQEKLLVDIFSYLPDTLPVVGLGVGSSFDYILGLQKRAPILFQKLGLEWLYRLLLAPRARWRRIRDAVIEFPRRVK